MFSIIIPLYNKAPYIQRAIDSVLNQSFTDYEIIVVNDGSTDEGELLVGEKYGDQVHLLNQTNQGVSSARNRGIKESKFPWMAFLDADDYWHPDYLFWIVRAQSANPDIKLLGSSYSNTSLPKKIENPKIELISNYYDQADFNTLFTSSSTVIHRSFFENNAGFKAHLIRGEDIDVWFRAFDWFGKTVYIHAPLMYYDLNASASHNFSPMINRTIFSEIYHEAYLTNSHMQSWISFRDKYLLLNLFFFYDQRVNFELGKNLLQKRSNSYFLGQLPYGFPFFISKLIVSNRVLRNLTRKYLKFCFRYIYT